MDICPNSSSSRRRQRCNVRQCCVLSAVAVAAATIVLLLLKPTTPSSRRTVTVLGEHTNSLVARKLHADLRQVDGVNIRLTTTEQMRSSVENVDRFDLFCQLERPHLATMLWQYTQAVKSTDDLTVLIHTDDPVLLDWNDLLQREPLMNRAVLGQSYLTGLVHSSLLVLQGSDRASIAKQMIELLTQTDVDTLLYDPTYVSKKLFTIISQIVQVPLTFGKIKNWLFYEETCSMEPFHRTLGVTSTRQQSINHACPLHTGYCCTISDPITTQTILLSAYPILPWQVIDSNLPQPYNAAIGHHDLAEVPFIATISEKANKRPDNYGLTPNFFDTLLENDCLPSDDTCAKCLSNKLGANCGICAKACPCYCRTLCHERVVPKFVGKEWTVHLPRYARDPQRLVPRIIHQTWYETLEPKKYPHMSRLVQSFKQSGWEYKFYSDEQAGNFLSTHFPAPVRQAYDTLIPGAFKADLFRYCVLLIHGGVYADVDILLETNLDNAVPSDMAFMVPMDEPGMPVHMRMCLWNGLIAASPGHPYLVKAIETVVNQVRNRFTSVDVDATFCPNPEFSILHAFDTLFTAGPCLLGASINRVMERPPQTPFVPGTLVHDSVPGRSVILSQDKWDMGAHRFTNLQQNLIIAATDLPDADDRANKQSGKTEHYSKTHAKVGIYGLQNLYKDHERANEDVRIVIGSSNVVSK